MLRPLVSKLKQKENESWQEHKKKKRLKMVLERCIMFTGRDGVGGDSMDKDSG